MKSSENKVVTLLIPTFNEIDSVEKFFNNISSPIDSIRNKFGIQTKFVFVDNASTDNTHLSIFDYCIKNNFSFQIIRWVRNYGVMTSVFGGLRFAIEDSDSIVVFDFDLQDPPELIFQLVAAWVSGSLVVTGLRIKRKEKLRISMGRKIFRFLYRILGEKHSTIVESGAWLLDQKVARDLIANPPSTTFLAGVIQSRNYNRVIIPYHRADRTIGNSKFSFLKYLKYGFDGIISVPFKFMRLVIGLGLIMVAGTSSLLLLVLFRKFFLGVTPADGLTLLLTVIVTVFAFIVLLLGVLGEYISRIFENTGRIPETVVEIILKG